MLENKSKEIICFCKISLRGYEAASLLEANGWSNVKVMEGDIMAWPGFWDTPGPGAPLLRERQLK